MIKTDVEINTVESKAHLQRIFETTHNCIYLF